MELKYIDEKILSEDGILCDVLDTNNIDFSTAEIGRKKTETLVLRANGNEKIVTYNKNGLIESSIHPQSGDAIFSNNELDMYIPRDSNGESWKFNEIESHGYKKTSDIFQKDEKEALKVKSIKFAKILPEIISKPTCIKDAWGVGQHQFLFEGATLKQELDSNKITGIAKEAFDATWELLSDQSLFPQDCCFGVIKKAEFEMNDYGQFQPVIQIQNQDELELVQVYGPSPFSGQVLEAVGEMLKYFGKNTLQELEGMQVKYQKDWYINSVAKITDKQFFNFEKYYEQKKITTSATMSKDIVEYILNQIKSKRITPEEVKNTFYNTMTLLASRQYVNGDIDSLIDESNEQLKNDNKNNINKK